jgi:hypothetical protein
LNDDDGGQYRHQISDDGNKREKHGILRKKFVEAISRGSALYQLPKTVQAAVYL